MKQLIFILLYFLFLRAAAQQPSSITIGKEEFAGIEIYDLIQNGEQELLIATDHGIFAYDSYEIKALHISDKSKRNSFFYFKANSKGDIYCTNLLGQFFRIQRDSVVLFYELADSLMNPLPRFGFTQNDEFVISSRKLLLLGADKKLQNLAEYEGTRGEFLKDSKGKLFLHYHESNGIFSIQNLKIKHLKEDKDSDPTSLLKFIDDKRFVAIRNESSEIAILSEDSIPKKIKSKEIIRSIYKLEQNELWLSSAKSGLFAFNSQLEPLYDGNKLFPDIFISAIYQDKNKNIWLGTFGRGLLFISNSDLEEISPVSQNEHPSQIQPYDSNQVLLGTYNGTVYTISDELVEDKLFQNEVKANILFRLEGSPYIIYQGNFSGAIIFNTVNKKREREINISTIKDIFTLGEREYLIATLSGVIILKINKSDSENTLKESFKLHYLYTSPNNFSGYFDLITYNYYLGTDQGLISINQSGEINEIQYQGKRIRALSITGGGSKLFIGTEKHGILIIKDNRIESFLSKKEGLSSLQVKKLIVKNNKLYIANSSAFQIWDFDLKLMSSFGKAEGMPSNVITNFALTKKRLWLLSSGKLQSILQDKIKTEKNIPSCKIIETKINGKNYNWNNGQSLNHDQNRVVFTVSAPSFKLNDVLSYKFKLKGLDQKWQYQSFNKRLIEYKFLPPGKYTLIISLIFEAKEGEQTFLDFEIKYPFWQRSWFIGILLFLSLLIIYLTHRYFLRRQASKSKLENQLIDLKLKAIQAQMNPHFIFNALNSIQDLVLKGDIENSYTYITNFSNLVRKTLDYSNHDFIDFGAEIDLLRLYLKLERLRFKTNFNYTITNNVTEDIQLPPMLIQPFVENAIAHGLFHSKKEKNLTIDFKYDKMLICCITDNGIGREKAREIYIRQQRNHESFSSNAIRERLSIFKQLFNQDIQVIYIDLKENGIAYGTQVTITIPIKKTL
ncbi:MAG: histidine kinase [Flavobacteriales bacterium]|nr:histidine kinase [Flavobacteriales bacterium]